MKTLKSVIGTTVAAAIGLTAYVAPTKTEARSMAAFMGSARYGSDAHCFVEVNGGPKQQFCDARVSWVIPVVYEGSGNRTIRVSVRDAYQGTHIVHCRAYAATSTGVLYVGSADTTEYKNGLTDNLYTSVNHPLYGGAWVYCEMDRGTRLYNVYQD